MFLLLYASCCQISSISVNNCLVRGDLNCPCNGVVGRWSYRWPFTRYIIVITSAPVMVRFDAWWWEYTKPPDCARAVNRSQNRIAVFYWPVTRPVSYRGVQSNQQPLFIVSSVASNRWTMLLSTVTSANHRCSVIGSDTNRLSYRLIR